MKVKDQFSSSEKAMNQLQLEMQQRKAELDERDEALRVTISDAEQQLDAKFKKAEWDIQHHLELES